MSMRKFGIFMLILCTALLCCGSVFAATYYCDSVNGDNNGDGSAEHPWINFDGFVNGVVLQPGYLQHVVAHVQQPPALLGEQERIFRELLR